MHSPCYKTFTRFFKYADFNSPTPFHQCHIGHSRRLVSSGRRSRPFRRAENGPGGRRGDTTRCRSGSRFPGQRRSHAEGSPRKRGEPKEGGGGRRKQARRANRGVLVGARRRCRVRPERSRPRGGANPPGSRKPGLLPCFRNEAESRTSARREQPCRKRFPEPARPKPAAMPRARRARGQTRGTSRIPDRHRDDRQSAPRTAAGSPPGVLTPPPLQSVVGR